MGLPAVSSTCWSGVEAQVDDVEGGELRLLGTVWLGPWVEPERDHVALEGAVEGDPVGLVVPSDFATDEDSNAGSGGGEEGALLILHPHQLLSSSRQTLNYSIS